MSSTPDGRPVAPEATGRFKVFSALRYREYRLFWIGAAFSNLGIWALIAGRLWLMHSISESALMLGLVAISSTGPILLFSMWGGVIADRVNRLRLVTFTRAMFSLQAFLTGALIYLDVVQPWHVIAISLATGVLLSFDIPSRQAIVPNLVQRKDLLNAIALYSFLFGGSAIIGPTFFAPFVKLWGLEGLFFFVGVAYALTTITYMLMKPIPKRKGSDRANLWQDLLGGLSYVRSSRLIVRLIAIAIVTGIFGMSYGTLLPIFATQILQGGIESYSYLLLASGIGGLVGVAALALFGNLKNSPVLQLATGVGFGLTLAIFSRISWLPASLVVIAVVSGSSAAFGTINNTLLQSTVSDDFRGRVMSIHQLGWGASALGGLLMGFLAHTVDAPFALTLCGTVTAASIAALALSAMRTRAAKPERIGAD